MIGSESVWCVYSVATCLPVFCGVIAVIPRSSCWVSTNAGVVVFSSKRNL